MPEDDSYQTVAGFILHNTGTIPEQGATVLIDNFRFEILKKSANRIELVRLSPVLDEEAESKS